MNVISYTKMSEEKKKKKKEFFHSKIFKFLNSFIILYILTEYLQT